MNDDELERLLRRYQPAPPDAVLRERLLAAAVPPARVPLRALDWGLVAAAVVLLVAWAATSVAGPQAVSVAAEQDTLRTQRVQLLARTFGDVPGALQLAEILVPVREQPERSER